jgi:hypothetical protein
MSRLLEISGCGLWIMRTRKACALGTTTPTDDGKWGSSTRSFLLPCVRRSLHRTAIALTQNSATPRMKLVGKVAFDEGGHIGGPSNVCVSRRKRGLLKRSEHCSDSLERGLASRHKLRLTRPFYANWVSLLPLMTNNHTFDDRRGYRQTRVLLAPAL